MLKVCCLHLSIRLKRGKGKALLVSLDIPITNISSIYLKLIQLLKESLPLFTYRNYHNIGCVFVDLMLTVMEASSFTPSVYSVHALTLLAEVKPNQRL